MNADEIREKCANTLGWRCVKHVYWQWWERGEEMMDDENMPNYPESLDACAGLRESLTGQERSRFGVELALLVIEGCEIDSGEDFFAIANATPLQICRAYLAAKGIV